MRKSLKIVILELNKIVAESLVLSVYGENHLFLAKNHNYFFAESQGLFAISKNRRFQLKIVTIEEEGSTLVPLINV